MPTPSHSSADEAPRSFRSLLKRQWKPISLLATDLLLFPSLFLCEKLSVFMLAQHGVCDWTRIGAQCGTCGGTRCVNSLLNGHFVDAFWFNPFVFACAVYLAVSLLLLHLAWLLHARWAKAVLRKMYSLTAVLVTVGAYVLFIALRNIPFFIRFFTFLAEKWLG